MVVIWHQQEDPERWKGKNDLLEGKDLENNVCSSLMADDRCCLERS